MPVDETSGPTVITRGNWSFKVPPREVTDGTVIEGGNFFQLHPDTDIWANGTPLEIRGGLFVNCLPPEGTKITGGNWVQREHCAHVHPDLVRRGLSPCSLSCRHRTPEKVESVVEEGEFREWAAKARDAQRPDVTAEDVTADRSIDADGVTVQTFRVRRYEYRDTLLRTGPAQLAKR